MPNAAPSETNVAVVASTTARATIVSRPSAGVRLGDASIKTTTTTTMSAATTTVAAAATATTIASTSTPASAPTTTITQVASATTTAKSTTTTAMAATTSSEAVVDGELTLETSLEALQATVARYERQAMINNCLTVFFRCVNFI